MPSLWSCRVAPLHATYETESYKILKHVLVLLIGGLEAWCMELGEDELISTKLLTPTPIRKPSEGVPSPTIPRTLLNGAGTIQYLQFPCTLALYLFGEGAVSLLSSSGGSTGFASRCRPL
ncbi:hypothetical protein BC834DRAFT_972704 [Gloeopeniophorella convolvens]|nr:hypothetical protein BC834DRAFT_972704 [Gloeopeniophorella convolvens]